MSGVNTGRTTPDRTSQVTLPADPITGAPARQTTVTNPGQPIMRPSFLQAFLANLGPALAGGLQAEPGMPFGTGLGGAARGIEEFKQRVFQNSMQQQVQQRENQQAQSAIALQNQQLQDLKASAPIQLKGMQQEQDLKQLQIDLMKSQMQFYANPDNLSGAVKSATQSLGQLTPDEQAQITAATTQAQLDRKFDPVQAAVKNIATDRAKAPDVLQYTKNYLQANNLPDTPANRLAAHNDFITKTKVNPQIQVLNSTNPMNGATPSFSGTGDESLKGMTPSQQNLVKGVANYEIDPGSVRSNRNPKAMADLLAAAKAYNPNYDQTAYAEKNRLRKDTAVQSQALNTATHHLDMLNTAIDNLDNTSSPFWNRFQNEYKTQIGSSSVNNFNTIKAAVSGELSKIFKGGSATDAEISQQNANLSAASSPTQLKAAVKNYIGLMQGRMNGLEETYEGQIGMKPNFQIISPRTQAIFDKAQAGDQAETKMYQGVQYTKGADGQWHKAKNQ